MPKRLPLKEFKAIYAKVPRLCVDVVIKTADGILLTIGSRNNKNFRGY